MSLFDQYDITFTRFEDEQLLDDEGNISYPPPSAVVTKGSLQPLRYGDIQQVSSAGKSVRGAKVYYTKSKLKQSDPYTQTMADRCHINGVVYEVFDNGDWGTNKSALAHNKVILIYVEQGDDASVPN